ncbi:hypothetical protein KFE25_002284 [Diacronema lutheri]|uniref:Coenzyme Q-binding protein COQ10 START domain-containing protein n=2 Tax=Diacronema lutheri TaxID=2081491 RepID=A0A8J5X773_DIALT|nr:hypothetical protein KFE25_002284 [Diacronema lutheri]
MARILSPWRASHNALGALRHNALGALSGVSAWQRSSALRRAIFTSRTHAPVACHFADSRLLGFSPEQLFDVVADVDKYADFVPFCKSSRVLLRRPDGSFEAELAIEFFKVTERYTSRVTLDRPRHVHAAAITSKLFRTLASDWRFKPGPAPRTCLLEFRIDFAVASPLYAPIIDHVLPEVTSQQVAAFTERCTALYGQPHPFAA